MCKKQNRAVATARHKQGGQHKRLSTSHPLSALYDTSKHGVNANLDPQLPLAINATISALEYATSVSNRRAWKTRVRELARYFPIRRAYHKWSEHILEDVV